MAKQAKKAKAPKAGKDDDFVKTALERYDRGYEHDKQNMLDAYDDLEFQAGNQWDDDAKTARKGRPCLTINRCPQFVRQVTGDIRMMRPSIKCVPVDSSGDKKTAEVLAGMIRYIENRSDAQVAYTAGADTQVAAGIGHWRVNHEYADDTTFDQELRVVTIPDGISVVWDPDAILPNKEDAKFCFVPVDISQASYKEKYPDAPITDFIREQFKSNASAWCGDDFVRVAEYWESRPEKRTLALLPNGSIDDLTDEVDVEYLAQIKASGARIEQRDSYCVYRSLITIGHVLEQPVKWPGRYIPIIPVEGEKITIGRKTVRHGVVRFAKDPQRMYNYTRSAQTEVVALQPKVPFIGTDKNFEGKEALWSQANTKPLPYLTYTPDPKNGGAQPQRSSPAVNLAGIEEAMMLSAEEMKATTGLYDASLGNKSNETSGKAILARQREGDVGTFVYVENFSRAIRRTGRILIDLIPHIYDTERIIRVVGDDGKIDLVPINQAQIVNGIEQTFNDVTIGAYDVVLETGPSYSTKRAEARDSMTEFMRSAPEIAPVVLDLVAEAQDWPNSDKFAKRMKFLLPPAIRAEEAKEAGEPPPEDLQQSQQPNPMDVSKLQGQELANQGKSLDNQKKKLDMAMTVHGATQPQAPQQAQQPAQPQTGVSEQEFQQFAQQIVGAVAQLQQQIQQIASQQPPVSVQYVPQDGLPPQ
jgi:hypothetical protein